MSVSAARLAGFTLIELIMFIVIVGAGLAGVLTSLDVAVRSSGDALAPKQALAIAEGVLEEITLKAYSDPDGGTEARTAYDNVEDYDAAGGSFTPLLTDAVGEAWPTNYTVSVTVTDITLGPVGKTVAAKQVAVRVAYPTGTVTLVGYRGSY